MITVVGEALIDLTPVSSDGPELTPVPGGSPYNVAIGSARLGAPTAFLGALSDDTFGKRLAQRLVEEGVEIDAAPRSSAPTTLALVHLDRQGRATYDFYLEGTAAVALRPETIDLPEGTSIVHVACGAVTLAHEPAGRALRSALGRADAALSSFDPNVRPALVQDRDGYVRLLEETVATCDVVKVSDEDLGWCYPDEPVEAIAHRWREAGPALVVVTGGPVGAVAYGTDQAQVPAPMVDVVDTVGAGDSFSAALLAWLHQRDATGRAAVASLDRTALTEALRFAVRAAAVTCTRRGADPPRSSELSKR